MVEIETPCTLFGLPDGYDKRRIITELATHHSIRSEETAVACYAICDTFDWRLFNKSLMLCASEKELILRQLPDLTVIQRAKVTSQPAFLADLPDGELKASLSSVIEMRALSKLAEIQSQSTVYRILNSDEKTVVQFTYEEIRPHADGPILSTHLWLKPVRGYTKSHRKLVNRFKAMRFTTICAEEIYFKTLEAFNKTPGDYSSKLKLQLSPEMHTDEATKIILRFLLKVIQSNVDGIKADLDIEFLHDFRVAIRRTRAALSQIKKALPAETTDRFRTDFAFLGKLSNQLRDLDVYLLNEQTYKAMLPVSLRDDIEPLFDFLRQKRSKALEDVINGLDSEQCCRILEDWERFLTKPPQDSPTASNADVPVIDLARSRIYKKYRTVVKTGARILEEAKDEQLHALRIECKKLRYLIEFFSSLFPADQILILVKQLKRLQDNLGEFNDFRVQKEYLRNIVDELPITDSQFRSTVLAIGGLIGTLDRESQAVRASFATVFTGFASPTNKRLYRGLFADKKGKVIS